MIEIIYASAGRHPFSSKDLTDLLKRARTNNHALGVSGLLLYHRGSFLQVLEGEASVVNALYEKIAKDPRHHRCIVLSHSQVSKRSFGDWSMGFVEVSGEVAKKLDGFSSFLQDGRLDHEARSAEKIQKVLEGFRSGRWRQKVT